MITPRHYTRYFMPSTGKLPKDQQKFVEYDDSPSRASDSFDALDSDNFDIRLCKFIAGRIKDWNYTDESGKVAPITWQNVGEIPKQDLNYLATIKLDTVDNDLSTEEKKSSSSTGTPSPNEQPATT